MSKTARGTKKDAQRVAAELTLRPAVHAAGRTVGQLLDLWVEHNEASWAPATLRDQKSRVELVKKDPLAKTSVARLSVLDVDRWHARLRKAGAGEGSLRNQHQALQSTGPSC